MDASVGNDPTVFTDKLANVVISQYVSGNTFTITISVSAFFLRSDL